MILWLGIQLALSIFIVGIAITGVVAFLERYKRIGAEE